jgi:predicted SAM-dependent methyltransferase
MIEWLKIPTLAIRGWLMAKIYKGEAVFCPICETTFSRFLPAKSHNKLYDNHRQFVRCPKCGSLKRHRFAFLFLKNQTNLFETKTTKLLHIAPERCLSNHFKKKLGSNYLSIDLTHSLAMKKMDITQLNLPDKSFDIIYCSHVLEHVNEDRKALAEFRRVLTDDGHAIIMVPITAEKTYEDPSITTSEDRLQAFGQEDHVRRYGPDFTSRLMEAGFDVQVVHISDILDHTAMAKYGLDGENESLFFCSPINR